MVLKPRHRSRQPRAATSASRLVWQATVQRISVQAKLPTLDQYTGESGGRIALYVNPHQRLRDARRATTPHVFSNRCRAKQSGRESHNELKQAVICAYHVARASGPSSFPTVARRIGPDSALTRVPAPPLPLAAKRR